MLTYESICTYYPIHDDDMTVFLYTYTYYTSSKIGRGRVPSLSHIYIHTHRRSVCVVKCRFIIMIIALKREDGVEEVIVQLQPVSLLLRYLFLVVLSCCGGNHEKKFEQLIVV